MSGIRCQVSGVFVVVVIYIYFFLILDKAVELVGVGSVINRA